MVPLVLSSLASCFDGRLSRGFALVRCQYRKRHGPQSSNTKIRFVSFRFLSFAYGGSFGAACSRFIGLQLYSASAGGCWYIVIFHAML